MRIAAIVTSLLLSAASGAFAQSGGLIGIYSDSPGYSDCHVVEQIYVTTTYYVVHGGVHESNTSQFMVASHFAPGFLGSVSYIGNLHLGDLFTGATITYVGCKALPHLLATIQYTNSALSLPCTVLLEIRPDPALSSGQIETIDCAGTRHFASGDKLYANVTEQCQIPCLPGTETTTWSRIKVLYQ